MYDPIVLDSRQTAMQRLADFMRTGHVHWTSGFVELARAPAMCKKFARLYDVDRDRNRRFRAKSRGDGNAVLLLLRGTTDSVRIQWFLLCTPGDNLAHQLEHLSDATTREGRMHDADYELVHLTKPVRRKYISASNAKAPAADDEPPSPTASVARQGKLVLTWRMREDAYEGWRHRAIQVSRGDDVHALQRMLLELYRTPGFWGVRRQVGKVVALVRREYRRRHGAMTGFPVLPKLYYVTRRPNRGTRLSQLHLSASQKQ